MRSGVGYTITIESDTVYEVIKFVALMGITRYPN